MPTRPAQPDDVPAIAALHAAYDTHWFGAPEQDEAEVRQSFDRVDPLAERSRVVLDDDGRVVAAAWWWGEQAPSTTLVVDPSAGAAPFDELLPWLREQGLDEVDALARDTTAVEALARHGWRHDRSSYELIREVDGAWRLDEPAWPDGVRVAELRPQDTAAVHELVYDRARWAQVPGHHARPLQEWREIFLDGVPAEQLVLAWAGDRLVGAALGRIWSDGTGWVSQLAVPVEDRGRGLGRALLLESLRRQRTAGADRSGLSVSALNPDALRLYLSVGLTVDREWQHHRPA